MLCGYRCNSPELQVQHASQFDLLQLSAALTRSPILLRAESSQRTTRSGLVPTGLSHKIRCLAGGIPWTTIQGWNPRVQPSWEAAGDIAGTKVNNTSHTRI